MTCPECALLDSKREAAYLHRERLEQQMTIAGLNFTFELANEYARVLSECDVLYTAYRGHQKMRHGVLVNYVGKLSGGNE